MSKNRKKREGLFDYYSAELASLLPDYAGYYACPLCLTLFPRSACTCQPRAAHPQLTLEHVVPKNLGITRYVLTCQICNNDLGGSSLDTHLHRHIATNDFLAGTGTSIDATVDVGGNRLRCEWSLNVENGRRNHEFHVIEEATDPSAIAASQAILRSCPPAEIPVQFRLPSEKRANLAQLKTGYLACFKKLGYRFILSPPLDQVRRQILHPNDDIVPLDACIVGAKDFAVSNALLIGTIQSSVEAVGVLYTLVRPLYGSPYRAVILPTPDSGPAP